MAPNPADARITYLQGDFLQYDFDRQFDVLVTLAVIEHIPDVSAFARRMSELCVPGGLVMTMTVDERSVIYRTARAMALAGYDVPIRRLYSKHHLNHFTAHSLQRLLEAQCLSQSSSNSAQFAHGGRRPPKEFAGGGRSLTDRSLVWVPCRGTYAKYNAADTHLPQSRSLETTDHITLCGIGNQ
jgi:hypothetical protein